MLVCVEKHTSGIVFTSSSFIKIEPLRALVVCAVIPDFFAIKTTTINLSIFFDPVFV